VGIRPWPLINVPIPEGEEVAEAVGTKEPLKVDVEAISTKQQHTNPKSSKFKQTYSTRARQSTKTP